MAIGIGLLALPEVFHFSRFLHDFALAIGTALLVAAILGASVDRWLKQGLLRDAFQSLFGYMLPAELREELGWVYGQELLCDRYDFTLTLAPIEGSDLLTAQLEARRDLRNVTSHNVPWRPLIAVDEWFHEGRPSQVIALRCTQNGVTRSQIETLPSDPFAVAKQLTEEITLEPDERVTFVTEAEETRHANDALFLNILVATANPRVTVRAPEGIAWRVMFGNRRQSEVREIGPRTQQLPGTLLPGQVIQVRWWNEHPMAAPPSRPET